MLWYNSIREQFYIRFWKLISRKKKNYLIIMFSEILKILRVFYISEVRWGKVAQSCPTLCDPVDCNLLGFSIHGILQSRILEWIAISFSRGSSRPRDWTRVSCIGGRRFNLWATREAEGVIISVLQWFDHWLSKPELSWSVSTF